MKNYYKINSKVYFLLLLIYDEVNNGISETIIDTKILNEKHIKKLLSCIGSVIFIKKELYYYAKIKDLNQIFTVCQHLNSHDANSGHLGFLLKTNLMIHEKEDFYKDFEHFFVDNKFFSITLPSEYKKFYHFLKNHNKKLEKK